MSLMDYGIAAVVVCNVMFLLLCTYMAWRMLTHMRDTQADLSAYANSLKAHAARLNRTADDSMGLFGDIKRELTKLIDVARAGVAGRCLPGDPHQQWAQRDPKALNRLIDQQGAMLEEVNRVDARQFDEWRRSKQNELDRLLQQKQHVQQEFARLKQAHDDAVHRLREQELKSRQHQRTAAEAEALKQELRTMQQQLQMAEARAFAAEQNAQMSSSSDEGDGEESADGSRPSPRLKELVAKLGEAEADRQRLRRQIEQIQDNLKRTLTEKEFIEDRFLALDAGQAAAAASAPEAAPAA